MKESNRKNEYADVPSLKTFFLAHGAGIGEKRVVLPYLEEVFRYNTLWMMGRLPGGKRHLAVSIPPGHGKTYTARDTIAYGLGLWPDSWWLYTSYAAPLAVEQTISIRNALNADWYKRIFRRFGGAYGTLDHIRTVHGGKVYGVGALGTITGFRGGRKRDEFSGGIVIDDPLKADEARSETARRHVRNWYTGTILNRRNRSDTPILLIAQRLHPEDLTGFLKKTYADEWHFLDIPAVAPGATKTIWPGTFSYADAMKLREIDPFTYFAQYQQQPTVPGGAMIREEWWRYYADAAEVRRRSDTLFIMADTAYGKKDLNDYSVFTLWGTDGRLLYLLDLIRGKWSYPELRAVAREFFYKHLEDDFRAGSRLPLRMYIENKASGQGLADDLVPQYEEFREEEVNAFPWNVGDYLREGRTDKVARVNACLSAIHGGLVVLPDTDEAHWIDDFIAECSAFSWDESHPHDDMVDCLTMAVLYWKGVLRGRE